METSEQSDFKNVTRRDGVTVETTDARTIQTALDTLKTIPTYRYLYDMDDNRFTFVKEAGDTKDLGGSKDSKLTRILAASRSPRVEPKPAPSIISFIMIPMQGPSTILGLSLSSSGFVTLRAKPNIKNFVKMRSDSMFIGYSKRL